MLYVHLSPYHFHRVFKAMTGERVFHGLHDPALTTGLGLAYEHDRVYWRLAFNFPALGPNVEEDSVTKGIALIPYAGFQFGVRIF